MNCRTLLKSCRRKFSMFFSFYILILNVTIFKGYWIVILLFVIVLQLVLVLNTSIAKQRQVQHAVQHHHQHKPINIIQPIFQQSNDVVASNCSSKNNLQCSTYFSIQSGQNNEILPVFCLNGQEL